MMTVRRITAGDCSSRAGRRRTIATASAAPFVYAMVPGVDQVAEFDAAAGPLTAVGRVGSRRDSFSVAATPDGTSFSGNSASQYDIGADGTLAPASPATVVAGRIPPGIAV